MKRFPLLASVALLLSACGVSSSDKAAMADDFRSKFTVLYLVPGAPGMVEDVEVSDFEKGGSVVAGSYHANFSATHVGDAGRSYIYGVVGFDDAGHVATADSTHLSVYVLSVTSGSRSVPASEFSDFVPPQILY